MVRIRPAGIVTFDITVLGSSAMYASVERACSGYLLDIEGKKVILDMGGGVWRNLLPLCDFAGVDGILISHRHPDHTVDLFQMFHARRYGGAEALPTIPLWAPVETVERVVGFAKELDEAFDLHVVADGDTIDLFGAKTSFTRMAHPPETLGCRIEVDGSVFAYSADSGPAADFQRLAGDADLFICEATYQNVDEEWEGHLSAAQAAAIAAEAGVGRLVLTHLPHDRDPETSLSEARSTAGDVDVRVAEDGLRLEVGS